MLFSIEIVCILSFVALGEVNDSCGGYQGEFHKCDAAFAAFLKMR
eukprot:UN23009